MILTATFGAAVAQWRSACNLKVVGLNPGASTKETLVVSGREGTRKCQSKVPCLGAPSFEYRECALTDTFIF
jgi:hypothetical protein